MQTEMAGEDASLDAATQAILGKIRAPGGEIERPDARENRSDRDPIEQDDYHDLADLEAQEREEKAKTQSAEKGEKSGESEGEEGDEAEAEEEQFIELPAAEEGGEAERIPLKEAVEAVKQIRQMQGDMATAVIRAEEEAFSKQDQITKQLSTTFETVLKQAKVAIQMMHDFAPAEPDPRNYQSTEAYYQAKLDYDAYVDHYNKVVATHKQAESGKVATSSHQDEAMVAREMDRASRYIPEFKSVETRDAKKAEILTALKDYGFSKEDLDDVVDHRAWRALNDLAKLKTTQAKAPEVRKHVKERVAKITNGRLPERDQNSGRFISNARKELREHGTESAFAKLLLGSGALKNI